MAPQEDKPVAVVFGATGSQGGSVLRALLESGKYSLRGATRNPESDKAKELASKGVDVIRVDQEKSEDVKKAFEGAYAAYVVTNPSFNPYHKPTEFEVGVDHAKLAKEAGVQHYIWSTLPNTEKISDGKYKMAHFTDKAKVDEVVKAQGFKYTTFVQANWYFDNINRFYAAIPQADGSVKFNMPYSLDTIHSGFDVDDIGPAVRTALEMYEYFAEYTPFPGQDTSTGQKASPRPLTSWEDWLRTKSGWAK
eukprot:jgi/Mesen1/5302/ME000264S04331